MFPKIKTQKSFLTQTVANVTFIQTYIKKKAEKRKRSCKELPNQHQANMNMCGYNFQNLFLLTFDNNEFQFYDLNLHIRHHLSYFYFEHCFIFFVCMFVFYFAQTKQHTHTHTHKHTQMASKHNKTNKFKT